MSDPEEPTYALTLPGDMAFSLRRIADALEVLAGKAKLEAIYDLEIARDSLDYWEHVEPKPELAAERRVKIERLYHCYPFLRHAPWVSVQSETAEEVPE